MVTWQHLPVCGDHQGVPTKINESNPNLAIPTTCFSDWHSSVYTVYLVHLTPPKPKVSVLVQQMLNTPMGLSAPQMTRYKTHLGLFCFIRQGERLLLQLKAIVCRTKSGCTKQSKRRTSGGERC